MPCRGAGMAHSYLDSIIKEVIGRINTGDVSINAIKSAIRAFEGRHIIRSSLCGGGNIIPVSCLMDAVRVEAEQSSGVERIGAVDAVFSTVADKLFKEAALSINVRGTLPAKGVVCGLLEDYGVYVCGEPDLLLFDNNGLLGVVEHKAALTFGKYSLSVKRAVVQALMYLWLFREYYAKPLEWAWAFITITRYSLAKDEKARGRVIPICVRVNDNISTLIREAYQAFKNDSVLIIDDCRLANLIYGPGSGCLNGRVVVPLNPGVVNRAANNLLFKRWDIIETKT